MSKTRPFIAFMLVACSPDGAERTCDLDALVPGLEHVVSAPRDDLLAEVLALQCSKGVAPPQALYDSLAADLALIVAEDPRMRLDGTEQWYGLSSNYAHDVRLAAYDDAVPFARERLQGDCVKQVTEALGGTIVEDPERDRLSVQFPSRLDAIVLVGIYHGLGVDLQRNYVVGDGSHATFRDVAGGRELLFTLGGGDCPAGCTYQRYVWWRVADGVATKLGEWGMDGQEVIPAPAAFDGTGFACTKCEDGRALRDPKVCDEPEEDDEPCADCGACGSDDDREFVDQWTVDNVFTNLDRSAQTCTQDGDLRTCMLDFFAANDVSVGCGTCFADAAQCIVEQCPAIGVTEEEHELCVPRQCGAVVAPCLQRPDK